MRAIHLEVVQDLTAAECLLALRRFAANKRIPKTIISDNATNFKLTTAVLKDEYCKENRIEWRFIPELAPWFGGAYERLVGLVKHCLKRNIDKHLLSSPSQLTTIVKEVEAVINCRPLTTVSMDVEHVLTPANFLQAGGLLTMSTDFNYIKAGTNIKQNLIEGWRRGQRLLEEFTKMFQNQYLASLRERFLTSRSRRGSCRVVPKIGDIVQIKDDTPRVKWKVGRINKLIESRDGLVRVAIIKLLNGETLRRATTHLYPLKVDAENENMEMAEDRESPDSSNRDSEIINNEESPGMENNENRKETNKEIQTEVNKEKEMKGDNANKTKHIEKEVEICEEKNKVKDKKSKRKAALQAEKKIREWTKSLLARNLIQSID